MCSQPFSWPTSLFLFNGRTPGIMRWGEEGTCAVSTVLSMKSSVRLNPGIIPWAGTANRMSVDLSTDDQRASDYILRLVEELTTSLMRFHLPLFWWRRATVAFQEVQLGTIMPQIFWSEHFHHDSHRSCLNIRRTRMMVPYLLTY